MRSIPEKLSLNLDLSKIKIGKIFKWLKKNSISDQEMMRTFNCGIGFCIIVEKDNISKIKNYFPQNYKPYEIGHISYGKKRINLLNSLKW